MYMYSFSLSETKVVAKPLSTNAFGRTMIWMMNDTVADTKHRRLQHKVSVMVTKERIPPRKNRNHDRDWNSFVYVTSHS